MCLDQGKNAAILRCHSGNCNLGSHNTQPTQSRLCLQRSRQHKDVKSNIETPSVKYSEKELSEHPPTLLFSYSATEKENISLIYLYRICHQCPPVQTDAQCLP